MDIMTTHSQINNISLRLNLVKWATPLYGYCCFIFEMIDNSNDDTWQHNMMPHDHRKIKPHCDMWKYNGDWNVPHVYRTIWLNNDMRRLIIIQKDATWCTPCPTFWLFNWQLAKLISSQVGHLPKWPIKKLTKWLVKKTISQVGQCQNWLVQYD